MRQLQLPERRAHDHQRHGLRSCGAKPPLRRRRLRPAKSALTALPQGASCYTCESLYTGGVVSGTLTDAAGNFKLVDVPTGKGVPLVVQIGKWRRQFTVDTTDCSDTPEPMLRLPANAMEGDLPNIAVSTGGSDSLECLLKRIGIDSGGEAGGTGEWVSGAGGTGHVHIFQGGGGRRGGGTQPGPAMAGGSPASQTALWTSGMAMQPYDIVILSCEGGEDPNANPTALNDYGNLGGRVFASHFHYSWFNQAPFLAYNLATWSPGTNDMGNINGLVQTTLPNGMPFPKGVAMQQWLSNVGALSNATPPELPIQARGTTRTWRWRTRRQPRGSSPTWPRRHPARPSISRGTCPSSTPVPCRAAEWCSAICTSARARAITVKRRARAWAAAASARVR